MTMRMLIDARHPEETRVAVVRDNRIEDFDFESADRRQIKGNIYLAKVARVEPSLQAAFIEYGGNRHGFLAFSEIHPDYYQIPREDRERLLREEQALAEEAEAAANGAGSDEADATTAEAGTGHGADNGDGERPGPVTDTQSPDEALAERLRQRRMELRRRYKIQDVIKRRQVMLVQVVKEERGNKGAALTTYLSLAGRYCVLMPNTSHGGGISRKISSAADRKRLKAIIDELALPPGMAAIVRTAGLSRTRAEIRRDFDYLTRLWDEIRETTLASTAPALIHEDSNLIKRAIRDIYSREIEEVLVEGEAGWQAARAFMKLLMPSHARRVQLYADPMPLFQRLGVEGQLEALFQPVVQLPSGGYMVINPTEALVSVDINSGRSTREHNIEETALRTNLEAAEEIARQLRLRDLAGLVVIDFIDMESSANVRKVEKALKKALEADRARIQVGRISGFGLLEMSRQRLRTGLLEASTEPCPLSAGTGMIRTVPSAALAAIRALEAEAVRGRGSELSLTTGLEVATYLFNRKRADISAIEARYGVSIAIQPEPTPWRRDFTIQVSGQPGERVAIAPLPAPARAAPAELAEEGDEAEEAEEEAAELAAADDGGPDVETAARGDRRRRRGRGRSAGERERDRRDAGRADRPAEAPAQAAAEDGEGAGGRRKRRRRRRRRGRGGSEEAQAAEAAAASAGAAEAGADASGPAQSGVAGQEAAAPLAVAEPADEGAADAQAQADADPASASPAPRARRVRRPRAQAAQAATDAAGEAGAAGGDAESPPGEGRTVAAMAEAGPLPAATGPADAEAGGGEAAPDAPARSPRRRAARKPLAPADMADPAAAARPDAPDGSVGMPGPARTAGPAADGPAPPAPRRGRRGAATGVTAAAPDAGPALPAPVASAAAAAAPAAAPIASPALAARPETSAATDAPAEPERIGWWRRTFGV